MFITFCGIDNTGKTTQIKLLHNYLQSCGEKVYSTREPGGCPISEKIRKVLVQETPDTMDSTTELLLINAARREHIKQTIKPKLDNGFIVLCDRFLDSTIAFQGNSINEETILGFNRQLCMGLVSDLTILIDLDPMIAYTREANPTESRFEKKGLIYMHGVRERFLKRAKANPDTHVILNGEMSIEEIHKEIINGYNSKRN